MKKWKRLLCALGLIALALSTTSCFRPWRLVRKAMPRPYPPNARFVILPISFRGLHIAGVRKSVYIGRKSPADQAKWSQIFTRLRHSFANGIIRYAGRARIRKGFRRRGRELAILAIAEDIDPGFYGGIINRSSRVRLRIQIRVGRRVFDEFLVFNSTAPNNGLLPRYPSIASRLRVDGFWLGRRTASYLRHRLAEP